MITLTNIEKKFDKTTALKDINLTLDKREIVAVIGSSGSGKSTLLRCINSLEMPSSGKISIDGKSLTKKNRHKLCFKIGMVFQQFNLFPHMSVLGNLTYGPITVLGKKKVKTEEKARSLLAKFSLIDKIDARPSDLSGGQKQKIAIIRALMMDPEILLFDEPTSALDSEFIKDIVEIINDLKQKMTMVIITHHIKFAKVIADRIIFMDNGLILADQPAKEFFEKPDSHRARLFLDNVKDMI